MNKADTDLLDRAAGFFELGKIKSVTEASSGLSNKSFYIQTNIGQYVLRILGSQTVTGLVNEFAIQQQLRKVGVDTATFLFGRNDNYYFKDAEQVITCSKRIQGAELSLPLNQELCHNIGILLALFHANVHLPNPHQGWLSTSMVRKICHTLPDEALVLELKQHLQESMHIFDKSLPTGSIHGDLHAGNMLLKANNSLAIFDFEESQKTQLILDICKSMSEVCVTSNWQLDSTLMKSLLQGYSTIRQVTPEEIAALPVAIKYVAAASAVWLYQEGHLQFVQENLSVIESIDLITF